MPAVLSTDGWPENYFLLFATGTLVLLGIFISSLQRAHVFAGKAFPLRLAGSLVLLIAAACLLVASGCGYKAPAAGNGTQRGTATVMITGTSGSLSHSTSVTLTVQ